MEKKGNLEANVLCTVVMSKEARGGAHHPLNIVAADLLSFDSYYQSMHPK